MHFTMSKEFDAVFDGFPLSKGPLTPSKTPAIDPPPQGKCPVDFLPDEILSSIFELGADAENQTGFETEHLEEAVVDAHECDGNEWEDVDDDDNNDETKGLNYVRKIETQIDSVMTRASKIPEHKPSSSLPSPDLRSSSSDSSTYTPLPFQVLVSHVCMRWRRISLSNPTLWTIIEFANERPPFHRAAAYITRSQQLPIEISIDCTIPSDWSDSDSCSRSTMSSVVEPPYISSQERRLRAHSIDWATNDGSAQKTEEELALEGHASDLLLSERVDNMPTLHPSHIKPLMDLLSPHVERWRSFELHVPHFSYAHILLHIICRLPPAPLLEVLQFYHREDVDEDSHSGFNTEYYVEGLPHTIGVPFSGQTNNLKTVALWGVHIDWENAGNLLLGLHELELAFHVTNVRPSWKSFEKALKGSPDIKRLSLYSSGPKESPDQWISSHGTSTTDISETSSHFISLRKLESITFAYLPPNTVMTHLKYLYMPALRSLTLDLDEGDSESLILHLAGSATRPFSASAPRPSSLLSQLRSVKLGGIRCEGDADARAADTLYQQMVNVRCLELATLFLHQRFVDCLSEPISATNDEPSVSHSALHRLSATEWYLQNLAELKISGQEGSIIRRLVAARKRAGFPLTKVLVAYGDEVEDDDEIWLRANVKEFGYFEASDEEDADEDMDPFDHYSDDISFYDSSDGFGDGTDEAELGYSDLD